jgi:hypothetical protein
MKQIIQPYGLMIICNRMQGHCTDCRICEMMNLNEINYNPATLIIIWYTCSDHLAFF